LRILNDGFFEFLDSQIIGFKIKGTSKNRVKSGWMN
jgi:hypothetical protein